MENLRYWLALNHLSGSASIALQPSLTSLGSPKLLFESSNRDLCKAGVSEALLALLKQINWTIIDEEMAWLQAKPNRYCIHFQDPDYPPLLKQISDSPLCLFVEGYLECLNQPMLAVVGSRNPTSLGAETALAFSYTLTQSGLVIVSGLAVGIDAAAHQGALNAKGKTVAVFGSGLGHIYPKKHIALTEAILSKKGALVSEFPVYAKPKPFHFPKRNRIISGLALGTLVVEAALHSGSLITAKYATEQGREVFAIPGSIHHALSRGGHRLIREGAKLVETAQDILEELGPLFSAQSLPAQTFSNEKNGFLLTKEYQAVLKCLDYTPTSIDTLVQRSGLMVNHIASLLLILELKGYVIGEQGTYRLSRTNK